FGHRAAIGKRRGARGIVGNARLGTARLWAQCADDLAEGRVPAAMTEREFAIDVVKRLQSAGFQALWAGGCVRDELLGLVPKDYDIATDARPEEVQRLFRRTVAVGVSFGVVEVLGPRQPGEVLKVQVATFRTDAGYSDGRRPDQVAFSSAREDALRRD